MSPAGKISGAFRRLFSPATSLTTIVESSIDTMTSPETIASEYLQYSMDNDPNCYRKPQAQLFGVRATEQFIKIAEAEDIYDLLKSAYNITEYIGIAIHTTGWASPLPEDGLPDGVAPSEHPDKKRVALVTVITDEGVGSAVGFAESDEIMSDAGEATGSLAEALGECFRKSCSVVP